jgi:hypothetical protein
VSKGTLPDEVSTVVINIKTLVLRVVTLCNFVVGYRRFGGTCCLQKGFFSTFVIRWDVRMGVIFPILSSNYSAVIRPYDGPEKGHYYSR